MAGKGSEKTQFKKGQVNNPYGRPKVPADLKDARNQMAVDFEAGIYKYVRSQLSELRKIYVDPMTPAIDLITIRLIIKSIEAADEKRLEFLLNRTIGKVVDKIDHTVKMRPSILIKTDGTRVEFTKEPIEDE